MKTAIKTFAVLLLLGSPVALGADSKTLAATMDVYVFPAAGQKSEQQSTEEVTCYNWAVENTGNDPFQLAKEDAANREQAAKSKQAAAQTGRGAGTRGALRGAAVGALIGEIADDDAGKGAAYGAAAGVLSGRRRGADARRSAVNRAEQNAESPIAGEPDSASELQEGVQRLPRGQGLHGQVLKATGAIGREDPATTIPRFLEPQEERNRRYTADFTEPSRHCRHDRRPRMLAVAQVRCSAGEFRGWRFWRSPWTLSRAQASRACRSMNESTHKGFSDEL